MINASIPLQAKTPNFLDTMQRANQAAAFKSDFDQKKEMRNFLKEHGQALYAGNENALGQYASFDPQGALGMRAQHQSMRHAEERLRLARAAGARAAADRIKTQEDAAAAQKEYELLRSVAMARENGPEAFTQALNTSGLATAGVTPDNFDMYLATGQGAVSELHKGILAATPAAPKKTDDMLEFEYSQKNPEFANFLNPQKEGPLSGLGKIQADIDAGHLPEGTPLRAPKQSETIYGPDGQPILQRGGPPKMTVDAAKNTGFYIRTLEANEVLGELDEQGASVAGRLLEAAPLGAGNFAQSPEYQRFEQARRDFVNAILRRESGAVISDQEFANAERQYFPVPGDSQEVIAQKRRNRETAIEGLKVGSGAGAQYVDQSKEVAPMTFEAFGASVANDPSVLRALDSGLSLEEIWKHHPDNPDNN